MLQFIVVADLAFLKYRAVEVIKVRPARLAGVVYVQVPVRRSKALAFEACALAHYAPAAACYFQRTSFFRMS
jgi:hypothetical protein